MRPPEVLIEFLKKGKNFILATHIYPDGDAIGSTLALALALDKMGRMTVLFNRDGVPYFYKYLPEYERFSNSDFKILYKNLQEQNKFIDGIVLLDCFSPQRAAIKVPSDIPLIIIDHHELISETNSSTPSGEVIGDSEAVKKKAFSALTWIDPDAPATGVMVYRLINALGVEIDYKIAVNLYTAIAIDTGTFRYSNTTPESLLIAAELIKKGVKPEAVSEALYNSWTINRFNLLLECLKSIKIENGIAISIITEEDFKKIQTSSEDTENFSNFPLIIKDVEVSILLREIGRNKWKCSLRSKGTLNVAKVAQRFNGGGHRNAAGFSIEGDVEEIKKIIKDTILETTVTSQLGKVTKV